MSQETEESQHAQQLAQELANGKNTNANQDQSSTREEM